MLCGGNVINKYFIDKKKLEYYIEQSNETPLSLSEKLDKPVTYIRSLLHSPREIPEKDIYKIAKLLKCKPANLVNIEKSTTIKINRLEKEVKELKEKLAQYENK